MMLGLVVVVVLIEQSKETKQRLEEGGASACLLPSIKTRGAEQRKEGLRAWGFFI